MRSLDSWGKRNEPPVLHPYGERPVAVILDELIERGPSLDDYWARDYPEWRSPMWSFAQHARGCSELYDLGGSDALDVIEHRMQDLRMDVDEYWDNWINVSDDPRAEFAATFDKVKFAAGLQPLEVALREAKRLPLHPSRSTGPLFDVFLSIAGHLQQLLRPGYIKLPEIAVGRLLGCSPKTISNYRHLAQSSGYLTFRKRHSVAAKPGAGEATAFSFEVGRFDWLTGEELPDATPVTKRQRGEEAQRTRGQEVRRE